MRSPVPGKGPPSQGIVTFLTQKSLTFTSISCPHKTRILQGTTLDFTRQRCQIYFFKSTLISGLEKVQNRDPQWASRKNLPPLSLPPGRQYKNFRLLVVRKQAFSSHVRLYVLLVKLPHHQRKKLNKEYLVFFYLTQIITYTQRYQHIPFSFYLPAPIFLIFSP